MVVLSSGVVPTPSVRLTSTRRQPVLPLWSRSVKRARLGFSKRLPQIVARRPIPAPLPRTSHALRASTSMKLPLPSLSVRRARPDCSKMLHPALARGTTPAPPTPSVRQANTAAQAATPQPSPSVMCVQLDSSQRVLMMRPTPVGLAIICEHGILC